MDTKKPVDTANEPVDPTDDGFMDTGVLHEDEDQEREKESDERED